METKQPKWPICQSCGMPMEKTEDFGTNADASKNKDYCHFCFGNGKFTDPNITLEQMINKLVGFAAHMNMTEAQARDMATNFLPKLRRWQRR